MDFMPAAAGISKEDYHAFHAIDRKLYALLVTELWREPLEAMQVMALWLWLEHIGFHDIVSKTLSLPPILINELVDEALACLNSIYGARYLFPTQATEIPLTQALVRKEISLRFFCENKDAAKSGLTKVNKLICEKALVDIMKEAIERNAAQMALVQSMACLGIGADPQTVREVTEVHPDDRTMFVTFSKGYPVAEWEVRDFFNALFGECIESFFMQEVQPNEQALFARIVFYKPSIIDVILNGVVKAKFTINGKHVWMRKFVPKNSRTPASG